LRNVVSGGWTINLFSVEFCRCTWSQHALEVGLYYFQLNFVVAPGLNMHWINYTGINYILLLSKVPEVGLIGC
jgi:hypothetical protein